MSDTNEQGEAVALGDYHSLTVVTVDIAGEQRPFLFDTGGGITLMTPKVSEAMACTPFGRLTGYRMKGERLDFARCKDISFALGEATFSGQTVGIFDLMALVPEGWDELGGLVALSTFEKQPVTLDLGAKRLVIETPQTMSARVKRMSPVEMKVVKQASGFSVVVLAKVSSPGGELWVEMDSGSTGPLILSPHAAEMLGVDLENPEQAQRIEGGKWPVMWKVPEVTLDFGAAGKVQTLAVVTDIIYDANMGAPLMKKFIWTLDLEGEQLWAAPQE